MQTLFAILQVALGLGFVIFVHELGHFLVAKACGVRCDKFFVGFDIGGIKLSRKWGETEYGIGVLPLGGYVKMYGQDDNVQNIAEEMEKSQALAGSPDAKEVMGPDGKKMWIDKRSYMAKSVPQRMAIISAGVIMNVIFAVVMAWFAFGFGVPETPVEVGTTITGGAAWKAGLKTGDRVVQINDIKDPNFDVLSKAVILGDMDQGVVCEVERTDGAVETLTLKPEMKTLAPQVGVTNSMRLRLVAEDAVQPNTPAAAAGDKGFHDGDQIVEVNGAPIERYSELLAVLMTNKDKTLDFTVVRGGKTPIDNPFGPVEGGERVSFSIGPNPMERLGIVPTLGPVVAIETGSPADEAGLLAGDQITAVDGVAIGAAAEGEEALDPVTLDDRLSATASRDESVTLTVERDGEELEVDLTPRVVTWRSAPDADTPFPFEAIGAACELRAVVATVIGGSPAAEADLRPGDRIVSATTRSGLETDAVLLKPLEFGDDEHNWPLLMTFIQNNSPDFEVELVVSRPAYTSAGDEEAAADATTHTVTLKPAPAPDEYSAPRGVQLEPLKRLHIANSWGERTELAFAETKNQLMSVVRFLQKIGGQVSVKALGGPITIAQHAGKAAFEGIGALLMSLVMLSANLAVLNFLPIPVLDGGHMVFLLYEGITGRPASEKVMIALQTIGLFFLLGLMLFVFTLDITRLFGIAL